MNARRTLPSLKVPSERAIAAEMAASGLARMQAVQRIRQRQALLQANRENRP